MSSTGVATVKSLKLGSTAIAKANWTFASGKLTIKKEYLSTLNDGDSTINIEMSEGNNLSATLTVKTTA